MGKKSWVLMGEYTAETTSFSECTGGAVVSPFSPSVSGMLKALRVVANRSAATSLINHILFRLTCAEWTPNKIEVGGQGSGLQTAPALMSGDTSKMDWEVEQPVKAGVPITVEAKNVTADTPVTVSALIYGLIEIS